MKISAIAAALTLLCSVAGGVILTPKGEFKTNCFTDDEKAQCEFSRVKICGDYYACDMAIPFETRIKRIGYIDEHIFVTEGANTYLIDEETHKAKEIHKVIPPVGEFIDKKGNKYYVGDGTTYVGLAEGKEIEIVTTGEYSSNQLALDVNANKLFILTFSSSDQKDMRLGNLFAVTIDPLNIEHGKVQAEKVEGDDSVTAMAVQGGFQKLLLGTRTKHGGKLIRLNRLKVDPCSMKEIQKEAILDVVGEAGKKLVQLFEESNEIASRNSLYFKNSIEHSSKTLESENIRLKRELNVTQSTLHSFTTQFAMFNSQIKASALDYNLKVNEDQHENDYHDLSSPDEKKECLPASEVAGLRSKIQKCDLAEKELRAKLDKFTQGLDSFMKDPILANHFKGLPQVDTRSNLE